MNSIENLREYALTAASVNATTRAVLAGYIDGIEREAAENERFRAEAEPFADRLREAVGERADVNLFGVDYTALPVDADGVPIRVGDVMEWRYDNGEFEVIGIGGNTLFYIDKDSGECEWTAAGDKRHHHAPTVEDVLREFAAKVDTSWRVTELPNATLAEYAAKLRLAGGEDE